MSIFILVIEAFQLGVLQASDLHAWPKVFRKTKSRCLKGVSCLLGSDYEISLSQQRFLNRNLKYRKFFLWYSLCEKCPNLKCFWSIFPCIWPESGKLLCIQSKYGKIRTRKNCNSEHFLWSDSFCESWFISYWNPSHYVLGF